MMWRTALITIAGVGAIWAAVGCKPAPLIGEPNATVAMLTSSPLTEQGDETLEAIGNLAVATVGDHVLTVAEIERRASTLNPEGTILMGSTEQRLSLAEELVTLELLAVEAERLGYFGSTEERLLTDDARTQAWLRGVTSTLSVTEEAIEQEFEANEAHISHPVRRRVLFILVDTEQAAQAAIEEYLQKLELPGASATQLFREVSIRRSTHPLAAELRYEAGWVQPDSAEVGATPELVDAVFALSESGELTPPIPTEAGWLVLQLATSFAATEVTFDDVRPWAEGRVRSRAVAAAMRDELDAARERIPVSVNPVQVDRLVQARSVADSRPRRYDALALANAPERILGFESVQQAGTAPQPTPSAVFTLPVVAVQPTEGSQGAITLDAGVTP
jgi:hypothetical protein